MSNSKKESFVFYETFYEQLKDFDDATKLKFYEAIITYGLYNIQPEGFSVLENAVWKGIEFAINSAKKRRETNIENGKKGGRPALKSKKYEVEYKVKEIGTSETESCTEQEIYVSNEEIPPLEIVENFIQNNPKKPSANLNVNVNGNVYANGNENLNKNEESNIYVYDKAISKNEKPDIHKPNYFSQQKKQQFSNHFHNLFKKPSLQEIKTYCVDRKNNIEPSIFYDFYESVGWMIGNRKMYDWKATIRIWEYRNKQKKKLFQEYSQQTKPIVKKPDYSDEALERFYGCSIEEHNRRVLENSKRFEKGGGFNANV